MTQKSSFIAICGAPNAGKSSIVNHIIGTKVSIVSPRPQTTRVNIKGIATIDNTQLVFVDTPGIMNPHDKRQKDMVENAWTGIGEAEQIVFVVDAKRGITDLSEKIIEKFKQRDAKAIAVINKIDLAEQEEKLKLAQKLYDSGVFSEVFMTSVYKDKGIDDLVKHLIKNSSDQPWPYPEDQISDTNDRFVSSEVTRERIFYLMREEIPYGVDVETESFKDNGEKGIVIHQVIHVAREGHKKIIIGNKGDMIKKIGHDARQELGRMFGQKVHLFLHVKVKKDNAME